MTGTMIATATQETVELQDFQISESLSPEANASTEATSQGDPFGQSLPPADHGWPAWRLLLAAYIFEALLWGFPLSFGVFQDYYSHLPQFRDDPYIAVVGTITSGMSYMAAPFAITLIKRFPQWRRPMIYIGWPICLLGLVAGSFAKTLTALILTQGVTYGVGFVIFYYPILSMVNEFWVQRRGMAYGFLCGASGVSGAVMPFVVQNLLHTYGYPTTLRAIAVGMFVLTGPLIPLLKGRLPEPDRDTGVTGKTDWSFLRTPLFWIYSVSNLAMGFGYFFPSTYIPSYATASGLSSTKGALLLALMSVAQVLGQLTFGYLSDRKTSINLLITTSTLVAALAAYTSWGLAHSLPPLLVFSLLYGFFAAGYTATWARMGTAVSSEPTVAFTVFGLLNFGKGVGNVLTGPISGSLLVSAVDKGTYGLLRYKGLVLFTGSCMLLSAGAVGMCYLPPSRLRLGRR